MITVFRKEVPTELHELVDPHSTALVIIDMQNDCCSVGGTAWAFTLEGTWGADFVAELQPKEGDYVVTKFRSSAFTNTNLDLILRSNGIKGAYRADVVTSTDVAEVWRPAGVARGEARAATSA